MDVMVILEITLRVKEANMMTKMSLAVDMKAGYNVEVSLMVNDVCKATVLCKIELREDPITGEHLTPVLTIGNMKDPSSTRQDFLMLVEALKTVTVDKLFDKELIDKYKKDILKV